MRTVTYSEARGNLKSVLDDVVNDVDTTIITRSRGGDAVVMSLENYNAMMETLHLLRSPNNAEHLSRSISQLRAGQAKVRDIIDEH